MEAQNEETTMLEALKSGSIRAYQNLYRQYFRMAEEMVVRYHGTQEDAKDVFQEALFVLVKKLRDPSFQLTCKLSTFLYAVSRNIWLKKNGKTSAEISFDELDLTKLNLEDVTPQGISPQEKETLLNRMQEKLNDLEEGCRSVLLYAFYQNLSHAEIAQRMGYTEAFVKVKKFRCLDYLRKSFSGKK